jgi:flavorubredoxin
MTSGPLHLAGDAWLLRSLPPGPAVGPLRIHANAMVLAGEEPVLVDTGARATRDEWWAQVEAVVDPAAVRWIFLSHDDADHTGNLAEALERCPDATVVASWLLTQRLATTERTVPLTRCRWVDDGESFAAGDRSLLALRPPAYDSPATRGLFDERTGVYWAADCFAAPVPHEVDDVAELDDAFWIDGFLAFHTQLSPWIADVDPIRWRRSVGRVASLGATTIASAHGPAIRGPMVGRALDLAFGLGGQAAVATPGQSDLEALLGR